MSHPDFPFCLEDQFTVDLFERLKRHPKRIVFTDAEDLRVLKVAEQMVKMEIGVPILLGDSLKIRSMAEEHGISLEFVNPLNPALSSDLDLFCNRLERIEKYKGMAIANAREMISHPHRFGAMMLQYGQADAMIAGNQSKPITILRALTTLVKPNKEVPHIYSLNIMRAPHLEHFGRDGTILMADTGVNPEPDIEELSGIAVTSAKLAQRYFPGRVRVAMLSHSTKGSNPTPSARKMAAASELAYQKVTQQYLDIEIDGEIQADVALDPLSAEQKAPHMDQKGPVDVLVYPNLDSAHIATKLLRHVGGAKAYGQIIMGLMKPAAQVPITASCDTILGTVAAIGVEAISAHEVALEEG